MESCPTQAVLPLVGLPAEKVIRDRDKRIKRDNTQSSFNPRSSVHVKLRMFRRLPLQSQAGGLKGYRSHVKNGVFERKVSRAAFPGGDVPRPYVE
ncbi:MAG: hypothetical protein ACQESR_31040 [Planctomycetota bacterium]